ncbi:PASTA domain-containing protein, partial [Candidatus Pacearchaeota archaeon]|nr:PASTA domain-containing protein [Candidatus Pacearchaeota archaeon]
MRKLMTRCFVAAAICAVLTGCPGNQDIEPSTFNEEVLSREEVDGSFTINAAVYNPEATLVVFTLYMEWLDKSSGEWVYAPMNQSHETQYGVIENVVVYEVEIGTGTKSVGYPTYYYNGGYYHSECGHHPFNHHIHHPGHPWRCYPASPTEIAQSNPTVLDVEITMRRIEIVHSAEAVTFAIFWDLESLGQYMVEITGLDSRYESFSPVEVELPFFGEPFALVPNIIGMVRDDAKEDLLTYGFILGDEEHEYSDTVLAGVIFIQTPKAGSVGEVRTAVDVVISEGIDPERQRTVPKLIGLEKAVAKYAVEILGLVPDIGESYDPDVPKGEVVSQDPITGVIVAVETPVEYVVSLGPDPENGGEGEGEGE